MSFIKFLKESTNHSNVVLQQVLDNLDDGHVDYTDSKITVNIGNIIKKSKFNNLFIIIHKAKESSVKLAKMKDGAYAIVITTAKDLPKRQEIDSFISNHDTIHKKVLKEISKYFSRNDFSTSKTKTSYESSKDTNNVDNFEKMYADIVSKISDKIEEYKKTSHTLNQQYLTTNNNSKKQTIKRAIANIKKETIGDSKSSFNGLVKKIMSGDEFDALDKEMKTKLMTRIESYYENNINDIK